jgi:aspartate ammonia-lyase
MESMRHGCTVLRERCVVGITPNAARMRQFVEQSIGVVTALVPEIGYEMASEIALSAQESGRSVYELVLERKLMTRDELDQLLNPVRMAGATSKS